MSISLVNDFVIRFANINGTGSASANTIFSKAVFRSGIPVSPKNIFPSNIQGLPTWYEVRINEKGYLGRREGVDLLVAVNPQSMMEDIMELDAQAYVMYDSTKQLEDSYIRIDLNYIGIPMMALSMANYENPRHQQLFKNIIYVGALAALLNIDLEVIEEILNEQFAKKPQLVPPNMKALQLGFDYAKSHYDCPLNIRIEKRDITKGKIMIEGNEATALGALYGGASVAAWYPITPSTSVVQNFEKLCNKYRKEQSGKNKFAIIQAEDELAAVGVCVGAGWNGARTFTSTSGAGISLMSEFIGLAYYAEIPIVIVNVQRGGPSTGMPTRTQQSDIIICAYNSHGDTKHPVLFPADPKECFSMTADALEIAERLQTPIFVLSDLDLGMNSHLSDRFTWKASSYHRGKLVSYQELENGFDFARYRDVDGDGVPYRTIPGTHPTKGGYFTRGTSHNEYARYTEDGNIHAAMIDRILTKLETAKSMMPKPEFYGSRNSADIGFIYFGTTKHSAIEAIDELRNKHKIDAMRILSFPFHQEVEKFIQDHESIFVIEQNRDAQMKTLLSNELQIDPNKLKSIKQYNGMPITAKHIIDEFQPQTVHI